MTGLSEFVRYDEVLAEVVKALDNVSGLADHVAVVQLIEKCHRHGSAGNRLGGYRLGCHTFTSERMHTIGNDAGYVQ